MKYYISCLFIIFSFNTFAQQQSVGSPSGIASQREYPGAQPNIPGALTIDLGFNFLQNAPDNMSLRWFRSKDIGVYYLYPIPIGKTNFSVHTGLGFGFAKFSFKKNVTLSDADTTQVIPLDNTVYEAVSKTQFSAHYVDIPLELRFYTKENYRGFMVAVGGKVGRLLNSYTKINYTQSGDDKSDKLSRGYNLNPWRYGLQARLGFRGINLTGYYGLSDLFRKNQGPQVNNFKVGLSIALF